MFVIGTERSSTRFVGVICDRYRKIERVVCWGDLLLVQTDLTRGELVLSVVNTDRSNTWFVGVIRC